MESIVLKISLLFLLYNVFSPFLFKLFGLKVSTSAMNCGLIGYCGAVPANPADIKMLMMFNMERGTDGTGWAINNVITKDTERVSKFLSQHPLEISKDDANYTIIAHARNTSSGYKTSKTLVHPFGIYKGGQEKENYDLILAMNGTLKNHELLCDKYEVPWKMWENSDTEVISKMMAKLGEKEYKVILETYEGCMNLLFFSPKFPNTLMVYKDPERTLFAWNKKEDQMYISSIAESLYTIGATKEDVVEFDNEVLYRINKGKITKRDTIVRIPLKKEVKSTYHNRNLGIQQGMGMGSYQDAYDSTYYNDKDEIKLGDLLKKSENKEAHRNKDNRVYICLDRYFRNGHIIDGLYILNSKGEIFDPQVHKESEKSTLFRECWILNGYLCTDRKSYASLYKKCSPDNGTFQIAKFKRFGLSEIVDHFATPIVTITDEGEKMIIPTSWSDKTKNKDQSFSFTPYLSNFTFHLKYGGLFIRKTGKLVCKLVKIDTNEKKVDKTDKDDKSETTIKEFLKKSIETNNLVSIELYYCKYRELLQVEPSVEATEKFYDMLSAMFLEEGIIEPSVHTDFTKSTGGKKYTVPGVLKELENCAKLLKKRLIKEEDDEESPQIPEAFDDSISTKDKLDLLKDAPGLYDDNKIISSIRRSCILYSNAIFQESLFEEKTFDEFTEEWIDTAGTEPVDIYEAVLVFLNSAGRLTDKDLLVCLDNNQINMRSKTKSEFDDFQRYFKSTSKKNVKVSIADKMNSNVEDVDFTDVEPEDKSKDEEDIEDVNEMYTPTAFESEVIMGYEEIVESMKQRIQEIDMIDPGSRTSNVQILHKELIDTEDFLEKQLKRLKL